uniref:BRCA1associated proteinlike [Megachile rotundata] n=1 Tax=Lepeophtheirus salmonis TaxID=72036 RepID=A0A0K2UHP7_LEPSM
MTSTVLPSHKQNNTNIREVSFCSLRLEIENSSPNVDLKFSSGRRLEDILENIRLGAHMASSSSSSASAVAARRGTRKLSDIVIETFVKSKESSPTSAGDESHNNDDHINFFSGNPFIENTKGILHLFKENETTSLEDGVIRSQMICMLGVPAKIKTPDLLQFTAPCHTELEMVRIIHDGSPNQYMALFRFRCLEAADEFYQAFNGAAFNSFEPDICTLVYVSKVETCKESEYYPLTDHTELPLCSICLERMDESVSTVLTILCNHTFHGSCLAKWEDLSCPVCRYVQTPEVVAEQKCSECQSCEDLWICLICGYVGCGRYVGGHSHAHFLATQHCYTMELDQRRVWDYVGDNFVHRLVQTDSADGKLVEAQGNGEGDNSERKGNDSLSVNTEEKMDSIQLEYTFLLTSQLESQRRYYEEKITRVEDKTQREIEEISEQLKTLSEDNSSLRSKVDALSKDKNKSDKKMTALTSKYNKALADLKEERHMNEHLRNNQTEISSTLKETIQFRDDTQKRMLELEDKIRDMQFHVEVVKQIDESELADEIRGGDIIIPPTPETGVRLKTRRNRRGHK